MKKLKLLLTAISFTSILFTGCIKSETVKSISENQLFSIPYGNFEEQLSVTDLNTVGAVRLGIYMRDGFVYLVNGESRKVMEY